MYPTVAFICFYLPLLPILTATLATQRIPEQLIALTLSPWRSFFFAESFDNEAFGKRANSKLEAMLAVCRKLCGRTRRTWAESARTAVAFTATAPLKDIGQRLVLTFTLPGRARNRNRLPSASLCLAFNASMNYYSSSVNKYLITQREGVRCVGGGDGEGEGRDMGLTGGWWHGENKGINYAIDWIVKQAAERIIVCSLSDTDTHTLTHTYMHNPDLPASYFPCLLSLLHYRVLYLTRRSLCLSHSLLLSRLLGVSSLCALLIFKFFSDNFII